MVRLLKEVERLTHLLSVGAGVFLVSMMWLSVADVVLRFFFNRPIMGTFEIVAFSGAIVMGLINPLTSQKKIHVCTDFLVLRFPLRTRKAFRIVTRCLAIGLFLMFGWNLIAFGTHLREAAEVSSTLAFPFYPIAYGLGISAFIQCLVFLCQIIGENHE